MIPYLIGAGIGYIISEIANEDKIAKLKAASSSAALAKDGQAAPVETPTPEPPTNNQQPTTNTEGEGEEKEVKFVAKSRGKKKND